MKTLNCSRAQELLPLFAGNDLADDRARAVAAHLSACEPCRRLSEDLRAGLSWLKAAPDFDDRFYEQIRNFVLAQIERDRPARGRASAVPPLFAPLFGRRFAFAASLAVLLVLGALLARRYADHTTSKSSEITHAITHGPSPSATREVVRAGGGQAPEPVKETAADGPARKERRAVTASPDSMSRPTPSRARRRGLPEPTLLPTGSVPVNTSALIAAAPPSERRIAGLAPPAVPASGAEVSRIEMQTADPNIRIIWLAQSAVEAQPHEPRTDYR